MKIYTAIIAIFIASVGAQAQINSDESDAYSTPFAIINDADGYTNIRGKKREIVGKIYDNQVFAVPAHEDETQDKYYPIQRNVTNQDRYDLGNGEECYIHKSRVRYLNNLPLLSKKIDSNVVRFRSEKYKVEIKLGILDKSKYKVGLDEYGNQIFTSDYDFYGIDGVSFDTVKEIKEITYEANGKQHTVASKFLEGYLSPNIDNIFVAEGKNGTFFIVMSNGDGAGSYKIVWIIKNENVSVMTFLNF